MTQTCIEGVQPPPAPKRTRETIKAAVKAYIERHEFDWGDSEQAAIEIASHWHIGIDGYCLAKALDDREGWKIGTDDVEQLDNISDVVLQAEEEARKEWAAQWNIQPPLPTGTQIRQGKITSVSGYHAAAYNVKQNGCTQEGRHLIVKFEDAILMKDDKQ